MLKKEFINSIVEFNYSNLTKTDIRVLFCEMLDSYSRDGLLTDNQSNRWILTDRELNRLYKISKGA